MPMQIGYARVSTDDQNLDLQRAALEQTGCDAICEDVGISGAARERPGLTDALDRLQEGDVLTVWKLDRLGRSVPHLVALLDDLGKRGIGFRSLTEAIDTTTAGGRLLFNMMAALAEFERETISERTRAGLNAARRRGRKLGPPVKLTPERLAHARDLLDDGTRTRREVAALLDVNESTLRRRMKAEL